MVIIIGGEDNDKSSEFEDDIEDEAEEYNENEKGEEMKKTNAGAGMYVRVYS